MSHRSRSNFSWSTALRDLSADRQPNPAGFLAARGYVEVMVRFGQVALVTPAGAFDRAGIMKAAAAAAKAHQERFGCSWAEAMSVSLKAAWQAAKTLRSKVAH